jgi:hypothetical protein
MGCVVPFNRLGTAAFSLVNGPLNVHICELTPKIDRLKIAPLWPKANSSH